VNQRPGTGGAYRLKESLRRRPAANSARRIGREPRSLLVLPGHIIVADTDGVAVVLRAKAARKILDGDTAGRRNLYRKLGMPDDFTVK
jgi:hypothetical protein